VSFDSEGVEDDSDADVGFRVLGGIEMGLENGHRFFLQGKLGFVDSPDFKATAGWTIFHQICGIN
jgi:hypothetical protein